MAESTGKARPAPVTDAPPDATQIDPLVDNKLFAIRDHTINQTGGALNIPCMAQEFVDDYQVSIWAKLPPSKELIMVSLRTIDVN